MVAFSKKGYANLGPITRANMQCGNIVSRKNGAGCIYTEYAHTKHIYSQFFVFTTSVGRAPTNRMACFHRLLFTVLCCSAVLEVCCITVEEFYSFGESSGDSFLTRVLDGSAGPITLRTEFPFSNQSYRNVYVSTTLHV